MSPNFEMEGGFLGLKYEHKLAFHEWISDKGWQASQEDAKHIFYEQRFTLSLSVYY